MLVMVLVILMHTSPLSCDPTDSKCIDAEMKNILQIIDDAKIKEQRKRNARLPICPMWVGEYENVECV